MQRFINKEVYVYCETQEESLQFRDLCYQFGLPFTKRWNLEKELEREEEASQRTFVLDWQNAVGRKPDGVSAWWQQPNGDNGRPVINFSELSIQDIPDISDFLELI